MKFTDHTFDLPLDHDRPDGERITGYAREVTADHQHDGLRVSDGKVMSRLLAMLA